MTVKMRSKTLALILTFVFAFTSVFSTGTAFATNGETQATNIIDPEYNWCSVSYLREGAETSSVRYFAFDETGAGSLNVPYNASNVNLEIAYTNNEKEIVPVEFDENGQWTTELTVALTDGSTQTYFVTVSRELGDVITLPWIDACYTIDAESAICSIDTYELMNEGEFYANIPWSYDEEAGITFELAPQYEGTLSGLTGIFTATEEGTPVVFTMTSPDGSITETYTIYLVKEPLSTNTYFYGDVLTYNGTDEYDIFFDKSNFDEDGGTYTVKVPYGTITDADGNNDNRLRLAIDLHDERATVDIPYDYDYSRNVADFELGADGIYSKTFTVTAESGDTFTATVKLKEEKAPAEPYNARGGYCDNNGDFFMSDVEFVDNYGEFYVPESFAQNGALPVACNDVDGRRIDGNIDIAAGQDKFVFTSANGQQYTIKAVILPVSQDVSCSLKLYVSTEWVYDYYEVDIKEALTKGETTVTVPYGAITNANSSEGNYIRLVAELQSKTSTVNIPYDEEYWEIGEYLKGDADGKIRKTVTVTAESGKTQDYIINVVEADGSILDTNIEVEYGLSDYGGYMDIDFEQLAETGATTVELPYYYNADEAVIFNVYGGNGTIVTGLEGAYTLDAAGRLEVECNITSPDGKVTRDAKITVVRGAKPETVKSAWLSYDYTNGDWATIDINFEGNSEAEVYVPYSAQNIALEVRDADGEYYQIPVTMSGGQGTAEFNSVTGKAYTVKVKSAAMNANTACNVQLEASSGADDAWMYADYDNAGQFTASVPYGTITDTDGYGDNYVYAYVYTSSRSATVNCEYQEDGTYKVPLTAGSNNTYTGKFTVTAENGTSKDYTIKITEDSGDKIVVDDIEVEFTVAYADGNTRSVYVDAEAAKGNGAAVKIPYSANEFAGFRVYCYADFCKVKGDKKTYYLDKDGKCKIELKVTSPNGKNTEIYTINLVKDYAGNAAEPEYAEIGWSIFGTGQEAEYGRNVVNLTAAATAAGTTVTVPESMYSQEDKYIDTFIEMHFAGWPDVEYEFTSSDGRVAIESCTESKARGYFYMSEADSVVIKATVTSENGKVTKTYTIRVVKEDAGKHAYGSWITDKAAGCTTAGEKHRVCSVCGHIAKEVVPALGHDKVQHVAKAATCTEKGWAAYETCSRCSYTTYAEAAAKGHAYGDWIVETAAGCETAGSQYKVCACGDIVTETIAATGHVWEKNYTVDKAATTKAAGSKSKHCSVCDAVKSGSKVKIAKIKKTTAKNLVYNGKVRNNNVTVVNYNGKKLVKGTDFTVTYKNAKGKKVVKPKAVGAYQAVVKFKGAYKGTVTKPFQINPQGTKLKKVTKGKKQFTATWNKKTVQVTGYQIKYSTKKNMKGAKTKLVTKAKTTKTTIKNLKAKQKYWVQIRTYKTVNGKKYYSTWSAKKVVTTK